MLFRDIWLGENIIFYVVDGVKVVILGFILLVWVVWNLFIFFFSVLIIRIFGVKRVKDEFFKINRMIGREFFFCFLEFYFFFFK